MSLRRDNRKVFIILEEFMKKAMKKVLSVILILTILVVPFGTFNVSAATTLVWPVPGHTNLTGTYGGGHNGIDISDGSIGGAPVVCAMGGVVDKIYLCTANHQNLGDCSGFGTGIVIRGDDGRWYQYAHMQANSIPSNVYYGAYVPTGAQVGCVGNTGYSTGNHLHFQINTVNAFNGSVNPMNEIYNNNQNYADIGSEFFGVILNTAFWKPISKNQFNDNVSIQTENGTSMQRWHFARQSDGAYVITSCYNGKVLEMTDGTRNNCTVVSAKDTFRGEDYKQWYLIPQGDGYVFLNKHYANEQWVLDLYKADSTDGNFIGIYQRNNSNAQIWSIYSDFDVQLSAPTLSATVDAPNVTFSWNEVYGESLYLLKIWKNADCDGDAYRTLPVSETGCVQALPGGTYYAKVIAADYFATYPSNVVIVNVPYITYTVKYDANGGRNAPESQTKLPGEDLCLVTSGNIPDRSGYRFLGWSESGTASEPEYCESGNPFYVTDKDVTLYAVWQKTEEPSANPVEPTSKPAEPTTQPTEPTTKPTEPTTKPSVKAQSVEIIVKKDFDGTNQAELSVTVNPSDASYVDIKWLSSDTSIATVDQNGIVTTTGTIGEATITVIVTNHDGSTVTDDIPVTVEGDGILESILSILMSILELLLLPFRIIFCGLFG